MVLGTSPARSLFAAVGALFGAELMVEGVNTVKHVAEVFTGKDSTPDNAPAQKRVMAFGL